VRYDLTPVEIKAGKTVNTDVFKQFVYLKGIKDFPATKKFVIYGGTETQNWPEAKVLGWQNSGALIKTILSSQDWSK
jgi:hypothetical protein